MENYIEKFNPANARTIRDMVYETLRQAIFEGQLKHGDRLVEKELGERLQVSRTPVREALRKLEVEGLVNRLPRKGLVVRGITADDIIEIYAIREALETTAIAFIIENITTGEKEKLLDLVERMEQLIELNDDQELLRLSKIFNDVMNNSSRMPRLISLINAQQEYVSRFRRMTMSNKSRKHEALQEHKEILMAVDQMDVQNAKELVIKHLKAACKQCLKTFMGN